MNSFWIGLIIGAALALLADRHATQAVAAYKASTASGKAWHRALWPAFIAFLFGARA